ncbi:Putative Holin (modular protein) [Candidatus Glomeribacter gigasporarum BEG34]|uniref:Putative Holin (Modular protein) n=1 Tax=Candidatus Glomeribacter gigasporarum BEG34 TaxID=1070319 RepID=G2J929_9BURK|nr:Putative Holin (modular protein) [Candidatus Glomeribacter gigasporarum]CCD29276.1 Putative Holin (modular protein) [Candidatus Glomeribacter gigasporarum BEG34]
MKCLFRHSWRRWIVHSAIGALYLLGCAALIGFIRRRWFGVEALGAMHFDDHDKTLLTLAGVGAAIAFGKVLAGGEQVTLRLIAGRLIIGAGLSMAAATAFMMIPNVPPAALVGLGSALGVLGQSFLERLVQRYWKNPQ